MSVSARSSEPSLGQMVAGVTEQVSSLVKLQLELAQSEIKQQVKEGATGGGMAAAWYANRGAVAEAQVELSHYDQWHFDNPTMDQVRQTQNLDEAQGWFAAALALDQVQPTARQRLAAIELARGQYAAALDHLQALWGAGWRDAVTRQLLGDAYVANGQMEAAVEVVRGLPWAEARLEGQAWSRYWVNGDFRRAAEAWAAVVQLNPGNTGAIAQQAEAERRGQ